MIRVGDKVRVTSDCNKLRRAHGGMTKSQLQALGMIGLVEKIEDDGLWLKIRSTLFFIDCTCCTLIRTRCDAQIKRDLEPPSPRPISSLPPPPLPPPPLPPPPLPPPPPLLEIFNSHNASYYGQNEEALKQQQKSYFRVALADEKWSLHGVLSNPTLFALSEDHYKPSMS